MNERSAIPLPVAGGDPPGLAYVRGRLLIERGAGLAEVISPSTRT